jgi:ATP-binding cassette subfamily B protein
MDDVLIPFQNGQQIETRKVAAILGGLFSRRSGWALNWARTYLLALCPAYWCGPAHCHV